MTNIGALKRDQHIIRSLEEFIGKRLTKIDVGLNERGFSINSSRVEGLNLKNLGLRFLPPYIMDLTGLEWLDLSHNEFNEFPVEIGRFTELKSLDISYNGIVTIPNDILQLENLEQLKISHNRVVELPSQLNLLRKLECLDLSGNNDIILPPSILEMDSLREIRLHFSLLHEERHLELLTELARRGCNVWFPVE